MSNRREILSFYVKLILFICIHIFLYIRPVNSQFYNGLNLQFGKNKVQYETRLWNYYTFSRFEVYFYQGGKNVALYVARKAEQYLPSIEKIFDYQLEEPIRFIIYNKLEDLKQSNIGYEPDEPYNIGGTTFIVGTKVLIYFDGNHENLDRQIKSGITQVILNMLVFGDNLGSMLKNSYLVSLPDWYLQGLVSFISTDWSEEIEDRVKDGILTKKYRKFNNLTGQDAIYAGHSIWKYVYEKYGPNSISNIIYMTRVSKNIESGFLFVLGISFKNLIKEWFDYYHSKFFFHTNMSMPFNGKPVIKKTSKDVVYDKIKLSPDGRFIAFTENKPTKSKLYIKNLQTGSKRLITKKRYMYDEEVNYTYPLFAWHPFSPIFTWIEEEKNEIFLHIYNLDTKEKFERKLFYIEQVLDYSYSHDGKMLVMSVVVNGRSDIIVYHLNSGSFENVTKDEFDDLYPIFINNSSQIVFSSNRIGDSIIIGQEAKSFNSNFDVFIYDFNTKSKLLRRLTTTSEATEIKPKEFGLGYVSFLSNENGIYNIFLGRMDSALTFVDTTEHYTYFSHTFPITNYQSNLINYDWASNNSLGRVFYNNSRYKIDLEQLDRNKTPEAVKLNKTFFKDRKQTKILAGLIKEKQNTKKTQKKFSNVSYEKNIEQLDSNIIDINNYQFGKFKNIKETKKEIDSVAFSDSIETSFNFVVPRQTIYETSFRLNKVVTQVDFDFLNSTYQPYTGNLSQLFINPGFNILLKCGVTDLLEDYRISAGAKFSPTFSNNELFLIVDNLKRRNDLQWVLYRHMLETNDERYYIKHNTYEIRNNIKVPFNSYSSYRGSLIFRYDKMVYLSINNDNLRQPDVNKYWIGFKSEYVFDNSKNKGLNLFFGTRWKIFAEYYQQINANYNNLIVTGFDFRKYIPLHRTLIWANRIAGSASFGKERIIYFLGGVDNWIFPKFDETTIVDSRINYAYQSLATNMRGFHQNIRNGPNFAVINSEIRLPIFRYLSNRPIKSSFLNNFQIVGFFDIGSAWEGLTPYTKDNPVYSQIIVSGPIKVYIENIKEPIVFGYGFGLRTKLFGYFIRTDWAWGVEDGIILPSVFYLSLGLDF